MTNFGEATCTVCGQPFTKRSHNAVMCSDECRRIRYNRMEKERYGGLEHPQAPPRINTCTICGVQFRGLSPHYPYKCCTSPECRQAVRQCAGKKSAKTVANKRKKVALICNVCGKLFKSESRFIRTCPECKHNRQNHPVYAEVWGGVI